ncbi:hypothetical protein MASR2M69_19240 [Bacteroidota bacterium]
MMPVLKSFIVAVFLLSSVIAGPPDFFHIAEGAKVTAFVKDGTDFWLATYGNGIFRYDTKSNELISMNEEDGGPKDRLIDCIEVNDDFVWAGTSDGLLMRQRKRKLEKKKIC